MSSSRAGGSSNADSDPSSFPTPADIIALANSKGYNQRRPSVSATLFFVERDPEHGMPPCLLNVFYTTRSIMTFLNHPNSGSNELWRSNAYDTIEELGEFFDNPRQHTGKGYRNKEKAIRGCVKCGEAKKRNEFSANQWRKGPDTNKCKNCVEEELNSRDDLEIGSDDGSFPVLTRNLLDVHNQQNNNNDGDKLERRQFNCPECPKRGRPNNVFFKKVPASKPIVKCPQCKRVTRGKCKRIYAIPKGEEKGYGLFKCTFCNDKWGSSRAVGDIAQECYKCAKDGIESMVTPFRIEVLKKKINRGGGGGGGRRMRRVPREPINEEKQDERDYGDTDQMRHSMSGGNSLARAGGGGRRMGSGSGSSTGSVSSNSSYDVVSRPTSDNGSNANETCSQSSTTSISGPLGNGIRNGRVPSGYKHKCSGCATGKCKTKRIPKSEVHDNSDGNTVSTRASVVTNSSIDKADFFDRDEDFSGFDEYQDEGDWTTV